jgi:hypothetical protein
MRYEDAVRKICGDDWKTVSYGEREGGVGVAVMIAFIRGTRPTLNDMAVHLGVPVDELHAPFTRLAKSGAFSKEWGAKKDDLLLGNTQDRKEHDKAWCHIAGIAGGLIGNF